MIQLTVIVARGATGCGAYFSIVLERVAFSQKAVEGVITCVQDFVRNLFFMKASLFSDTGMAVLKYAVAADESVIESKMYNPWSMFDDGFNQQVALDLLNCRKDLVVRRNMSRDISERWLCTRNASCLLQQEEDK